MPKFAGQNGGTTSRGVSANQITVVLRLTNDYANSTVGAYTNAQLVGDIQSYLNIFNKTFETYGRQVVLKTFQGQGNENSEIEGLGQAQAEADAQTAHDMGAFAVADPLTSNEYIDALASRGVISLGGGENALHEYQANAPYEYGTPIWSIAQNEGASMAALACQRLVGMPAVFSSDPLFQRTTRVFGAVEPEQPAYAGGMSTLQSAGASHCGLKLASAQQYSININQAAEEAVPVIAALKSKGVTTVFVFTDPVFLAALTQAADAQQYHPEWVTIELGDQFTRDSASDQMKDGMLVSFQGQTAPCDQRESTKVLKLFGHAPQSSCGLLGRDIIYFWMLQFFNAVQNAGPTLNPVSFRQGWSKTPTLAGLYGLFRYDPAWANVAGDFTLSWWDPNATSNDDGQKGAWQACNSGARYPYPYPTNMGSGQPHCFGR